MNERIRKLAKNHLMHESWTSYGESIQEDYYEFYPEDLEEFAELIVLECSKIVLNCGIPGSNTERDFIVASREIKHHFGVEE